MKFKIILFFLVAPIMISCSDKSTPSTSESIINTSVKIDTTTPDKALKSYWDVRDAIRVGRIDLYKQSIEKNKNREKQLANITTDSLIKDFQIDFGTVETFSRDILEVKVESESRAVVLAVIKNTTPVSANAEITQSVEERRRNGERYRYILERDQSGWRVAEIWEWDTYPSPGWEKKLPKEGKPSVPSFTYNGK